MWGRALWYEKSKDYYPNGKRLKVSEVYWNLDALLYESQQASRQMQQVVNKPQGILAFIAKGWNLKKKEICCNWTSSYGIRHRVLFSQTKKQIVNLEAVQRRFARPTPGMRGLIYRWRYNSLGVYSLEFKWWGYFKQMRSCKGWTGQMFGYFHGWKSLKQRDLTRR